MPWLVMPCSGSSSHSNGAVGKQPEHQLVCANAENGAMQSEIMLRPTRTEWVGNVVFRDSSTATPPEHRVRSPKTTIVRQQLREDERNYAGSRSGDPIN